MLWEKTNKQKTTSVRRRVLKSLLAVAEKEFIHNSRLHVFPLAAPGIYVKSGWKQPISVGFVWQNYRIVGSESPLGRDVRGNAKA